MKHQIDQSGKIRIYMRNYPTEKQAYNQILKEVQARGFGLLLAYTRLGSTKRNEPSWAEVVLVGENYNSFFFHINPKSVPHFENPIEYLSLTKDQKRQHLIRSIRSEQQKAMDSGRFIYVLEERVGLKEVRKAIQQRIADMYPELLATKLYLVDINKIDPAAEYYSEIEEAIQEKYHQSLKEYLTAKKPLKI